MAFVFVFRGSGGLARVGRGRFLSLKYLAKNPVNQILGPGGGGVDRVGRVAGGWVEAAA